MKLLARMNRVVRISTIAVILCVALTGGSLIYKHGTAHACGSNIIPTSTTRLDFIDNNTFVTIIFSLWYNSCNQQNFASANITSGSFSGLQVVVVRNAGIDGGTIGEGNSNCPSKGVCNSPGVYSPDNTTYAQILLGNGDIITTASF